MCVFSSKVMGVGEEQAVGLIDMWGLGAFIGFKQSSPADPRHDRVAHTPVVEC